MGGRRGGEVLESISLTVDGEEAVLSRTTVLGDAYRLIHTMTITDEGIEDDVSLIGLNSEL